ncbi:hypothetical protein ACPV5W_00430 [Vibrio astriarenae]
MNGVLLKARKFFGTAFLAVPSFIASVIAINGELDGSILNINLRDVFSGGLETYRFCVLLVLSVVGLNLLVCVWRLIRTDISKLKRYLNGANAILSLLIMLVAMSEFSAPSMTFASRMLNDSSHTYAKVQEQSGIEFQIDSCSKSGTKTSCFFTLYNFGEDQQFYSGDKTRIVDSRGNLVYVSNFKFGEMSLGKMSYSGKFQFPKDTSINMRVTFDSTNNSDADMVKALYFTMRFDGKIRELIWRNIHYI